MFSCGPRVSDGFSSPPKIGVTIGNRYRLLRKIGEGGTSFVYEALHVDLGLKVALKVLVGGGSFPGARERFEREARLAAQLLSPNVARVSDFGFSDYGPFLVMELLQGRDLESELDHRKGRFPITEAVDVVLEAALGLAEVHHHGLAHRDVKPGNIFLAWFPQGRVVKILDFGLAKQMTEEGPALTESSSTLGTPAYMAPEQVVALKNAEARTDQHALGVILYELVVGKVPYAARTIARLFVAIVHEPVPDIRKVDPTVPAPLAEALLQAMAKEPTKRFPSLCEFADAIAPFGTARATELAKGVRAILMGQPGPTRPGVVNEESLRDSWSHAPPKPPQAGEVTAPATPFGQEVAAIRARIASEGGLDKSDEPTAPDGRISDPPSSSDEATRQFASPSAARKGLSQTVPMSKDTVAKAAASAAAAAPAAAVPTPPGSSPGALAWTGVLDPGRAPIPPMPNDDDTGDTRLEPTPGKSGSSIWVLIAIAVAALVIGAVIAFVIIAPGKTTKTKRGKTPSSASVEP